MKMQDSHKSPNQSIKSMDCESKQKSSKSDTKYSSLRKYIALLLSLLTVLISIKYCLLNYNKSVQAKIPNVETIILGDSHVKCALNLKFIDNSANLSQTAQNIIYSYYVLKKLIDDRNQFHNVILGLSYHSIGVYYVKLNSDEMMRRYHYILDRQFFDDMKKANELNGIMRLRYYVDTYYLPIGISNDFYEMVNIRNKKLSGFQFLGEFEQNNRAKLVPPLFLNIDKRKGKKYIQNRNHNYEYLDETIKRHYSSPSGLQSSTITLKYIEKIALLCIENNMKLYLVNTPVHSEYKKRIPPEILKAVNDIAVSMEKSYKVKYLNYSDYNLNEKYFSDYDHLTTQGSEIFSKELARQLKQ